MTDTEKAALCARIDELCAEVERLREENHAIGMAAYEVGYKDASAHYELEYCPACKNIADLQEALDENAKLREERNHWKVEQTHAYSNWEDAHKRVIELEAENAKLRELVCVMSGEFSEMSRCSEMPCGECPVKDECAYEERLMRELGIEVDR